MGPKFNDSVLIRDRRGEDTDRGKGHAKIEAEIGVMQPQAKEHLEPPEAGRGKEGLFSRAFRGSMALQIP